MPLTNQTHFYSHYMVIVGEYFKSIADFFGILMVTINQCFILFIIVYNGPVAVLQAMLAYS